MNNITFVTGLWDIGRDNLEVGWVRSFEKHYLEKFKDLLKVDVNLIIYGDDKLEKFVWEHRNQTNTLFIKRELSWFKNEFYEKIQQIRNNPNWFNQAGWLKTSTQGSLELYNPLVMSKVFLLNDARIFDKFNSDYMFWIDAGISNTVNIGYFTHDKIQEKFPHLFNKFSFIAFPYEANNEIHGFSYPKINDYATKDVNLVCRGGLFGGPKDTIDQVNSLYYSVLNATLNDGYMGTEESIFSILLYGNPRLFNYFTIEENGLISKFCEDVKNDKAIIKSFETKIIKSNTSKVGLYVITFNSPKQFETLIQSMLDYDSDFINKPKKFLLDNSTDLTTTPKYIELCEQYGFEHIKKDNIGIVGGRVFIAEHFDQTDLDYYYFFEDDMFFYSKMGEICRNGFNRYVSNLYKKSLEIMKRENYDYLKLNYTEFYGDNSVQFSWYNVPQSFREKRWPENKKLPVQGLDPNAPNTVFKSIKSYTDLAYADGEIYLCNWPILFNREGNHKCFLKTKWAHPYEQTLMSYCYQETVKGNVNPAILLLTPTEHNRFDFYASDLRKES